LRLRGFVSTDCPLARTHAARTKAIANSTSRGTIAERAVARMPDILRKSIP
jgi:hypothetical protein